MHTAGAEKILLLGAIGEHHAVEVLRSDSEAAVFDGGKRCIADQLAQVSEKPLCACPQLPCQFGEQHARVTSWQVRQNAPSTLPYWGIF
jgi:hypothetical protein